MIMNTLVVAPIVLASIIFIETLRGTFFPGVSRAAKSVIKYFAFRSVRSSPVTPAMALNKTTFPPVAAFRSLPARFKSKINSSIDYNVYDSPAYIRKAEAELSAQLASLRERKLHKC